MRQNGQVRQRAAKWAGGAGEVAYARSLVRDAITKVFPDDPDGRAIAEQALAIAEDRHATMTDPRAWSEAMRQTFLDETIRLQDEGMLLRMRLTMDPESPGLVDWVLEEVGQDPRAAVDYIGEWLELWREALAETP